MIVGQTTKITSFPSILESKSQFYRVKTQEGAGILDCPDQGTLEFYCTGYTKQDMYGRNRQLYHRNLFTQTVKRSVDGKLYPFNKNEYQLVLRHDPDNKYDPNGAALHVIMIPVSSEMKYVFDGIIQLEAEPNLEEIDLGFVPQRINVSVLKNKSMINNIEILKVREGFHNKYYTTKVIINYGHNKKGFEASNTANRFLDLIDEL